MRASRGMGAILPSKQPKKIQRKDGAEVDVYAAGGKVGLYANINARREAGLPPKKPGQKGYPTATAFKRSAKTVKK
jgi:hypothetical protein